MSFLDVFKDFEYEDEEDQSTFFHDTFSQLLNEPDPETVTHSQPPTLINSPATKPRASVADFEEAYTVLKSIESVHQPLSYTSLNAYLHHSRNIYTNKRSVRGVTWPEHPQSFSQSRLISNPPNHTENVVDDQKIPLILPNDSDSETSADEDDRHGLCKMANSRHLYQSLLLTVHSIYTRKSHKSAIDPRLAHSIARRTALLLQTLFTRTALNRRSAARLLSHFSHTADFDNVPSNWETTKLAAQRLIGQAALDKETFEKFSARLNDTFK